MHVLSLNAGSATLKFGVFDPVPATPLMEGTIEPPAVDAAAFDEIERRLREAGMPAIDAVGHRVAHGGPRVSEAVLVDADTERAIEQAAPLAPQHNPVALAGIRLARERWPGLPQVAVLDTAFHAGMSDQASLYAVPQAWRDAGVRRYGFHGLSHRHVLEAVSVGSGSDVAKETGGIILVRSDVRDVVTGIRLSRVTMRTIKRNLFWAFIYNGIGVPIAAFGLLNSSIPAAAMALSSLSVIVNSALLKRARLQ
jgi:acetate kinase